MALYRPGPSWQREPENSLANKVIVSDPLSLIYDEGRWSLNKLSPMYNFQYDGVRLKQYGSKFRQAIVGSIAANASLKYTVELEVLPHLKYAEDDPDGLTIKVSSTQENTNKSKIVYSTVLLSWGESSKLNNSIHLPFMLEKGEKKVGEAIKTTMQTIFDCNIKKFSFAPNQLLQFGLFWLESDNSRGDELFNFVFKNPNCKGKITISLKVVDLKIIWDGVKEEANETFEQLNLAYNMLHNQILYTLSIDLTALDLCAVMLPKGEVINNGIVKLTTPEMVNCIFTVLNNIRDVCTAND